MGEVDAYVKLMVVERGEDDDAEEKAKDNLAKRLNTIRRLHAATHNGEQLDWLEMQDRAAKTEAAGDKAADSETGAEDEPDEE